MVAPEIPPNHPEIEEAVLAYIMCVQDSILETVDFLNPDCFYSTDFQKVYTKGILPLFHRDEKIDMLSVANELKKNELLEALGGHYFISTITNKVT